MTLPPIKPFSKAKRGFAAVSPEKRREIAEERPGEQLEQAPALTSTVDIVGP
jgi:hypothetical protein